MTGAQAFADVATAIVGLGIVIATLWSAALTVVVPRAERPRITTLHFAVIDRLGRRLASDRVSPERRDRVESRIGPFALVTLPFVWASQVIVGFGLVFWRPGDRGIVEAIELSGSSLTTLGIRTAEGGYLTFVIIEGLIGLGLVGLVISYLPTIYDAYTDREIAVARLEVRAGRPAHPVTFLERSQRIGWLGEMDSTWSEWEAWFLQIEETHTTHTSLPMFRSAYPGRSWLIAAGTVLDAASFIVSTADIDASPRAELCIRSGFTTLRSLADTFGVEYPIDPVAVQAPRTISMRRQTFDLMCDRLQTVGVPIKPDRDAAWADFAGWRVNYEAALLGLMDRFRVYDGNWFREQQMPANPIM